MKRHRVEFSPEARQHVRTIHAWWATNRAGSSDLFRDELAAAVAKLRTVVRIGKPYPHPAVADLRRLLMPRTQYHVYYRVEEQAVVRVYAIWQTARGRGPELP